MPLGYRVEDGKLVIDPSEAETVRSIFERYLVVESLPELQRELRESGTLTRRRELATGKVIGGVALATGPLAYLLRNRVYLGELNHRTRAIPVPTRRSSMWPSLRLCRQSSPPIGTVIITGDRARTRCYWAASLMTVVAG